MSEHDEQVALFDWARLNESKYPQLKMLFAIPNGGLRNKLVAKKLKREGVKAGVLDIFLSVPNIYNNEYFDAAWWHGLYIEMKFNRNKTTIAQDDWIELCKKYNYQTAVCYSFEEAKQVIIDYLGIE